MANATGNHLLPTLILKAFNLKRRSHFSVHIRFFVPFQIGPFAFVRMLSICTLLTHSFIHSRISPKAAPWPRPLAVQVLALNRAVLLNRQRDSTLHQIKSSRHVVEGTLHIKCDSRGQMKRTPPDSQASDIRHLSASRRTGSCKPSHHVNTFD